MLTFVVNHNGLSLMRIHDQKKIKWVICYMHMISVVFRGEDITENVALR